MQAAGEACPDCGTVRRGARYCASCRYDFDSLTHRYRGTQWSQALASDAALGAMPRPLPSSLLRTLGPIVLFYFGLAIVAGLIVWSNDKGLLPEVELPRDVVLLLFVAIPMIAGVVSQIIPGRRARGPLKGSLLAFVGWIALGIALWMTGGWLIEGIAYPGGALEHAVVAITGASIFRLLLLAIP